MDCFYAILKKQREKRKATQKNVSEAIGVDQQTLRRYESGERKPDTEMLLRIANYYDVSADYLLGRTNSERVDNKIQAAVDVTGLSDESINMLISLNNDENYWNRYVIDSMLSDLHFYQIVSALVQTMKTPDCVLNTDDPKYPITRKELLENIMNKHFMLMIKSIMEKYEELNGGADNG